VCDVEPWAVNTEPVLKIGRRWIRNPILQSTRMSNQYSYIVFQYQVTEAVWIFLIKRLTF
jgi:hypothetical protein